MPVLCFFTPDHCLSPSQQIWTLKSDRHIGHPCLTKIRVSFFSLILDLECMSQLLAAVRLLTSPFLCLFVYYQRVSLNDTTKNSNHDFRINTKPSDIFIHNKAGCIIFGSVENAGCVYIFWAFCVVRFGVFLMTKVQRTCHPLPCYKEIMPTCLHYAHFFFFLPFLFKFPSATTPLLLDILLSCYSLRALVRVCTQGFISCAPAASPESL